MAPKSQCGMNRGAEEEPRADEEVAGSSPYVNAVLQPCGVYKCLIQTLHRFLFYKSRSVVATLEQWSLRSFLRMGHPGLR